jgi:hypothetical protein
MTSAPGPRRPAVIVPACTNAGAAWAVAATRQAPRPGRPGPGTPEWLGVSTAAADAVVHVKPGTGVQPSDLPVASSTPRWCRLGDTASARLARRNGRSCSGGSSPATWARCCRRPQGPRMHSWRSAPADGGRRVSRETVNAPRLQQPAGGAGLGLGPRPTTGHAPASSPTGHPDADRPREAAPARHNGPGGGPSPTGAPGAPSPTNRTDRAERDGLNPCHRPPTVPWCRDQERLRRVPARAADSRPLMPPAHTPFGLHSAARNCPRNQPMSAGGAPEGWQRRICVAAATPRTMPVTARAGCQRRTRPAAPGPAVIPTRWTTVVGRGSRVRAGWPDKRRCGRIHRTGAIRWRAPCPGPATGGRPLSGPWRRPRARHAPTPTTADTDHSRHRRLTGIRHHQAVTPSMSLDHRGGPRPGRQHPASPAAQTGRTARPMLRSPARTDATRAHRMGDPLIVHGARAGEGVGGTTPGALLSTYGRGTSAGVRTWAVRSPGWPGRPAAPDGP